MNLPIVNENYYLFSYKDNCNFRKIPKFDKIYI